MTYPPGPYGYGYAPPPPPPKPGVIPLAPMTFGQILTGAFSAFGRYWKPLLGVAATAFGVATALVVGAVLVAWNAVSDNVDRLSNIPNGQDPDIADIRGLFLAFGCVWLTGMLSLMLANTLVYAAVPVVAQEAVLGRPVGFAAVWGRAWSRAGAVLSAVVLSMLAMLVPVLLFIVGFGLMMFGMLAGIGASGSDEGVGTTIAGLVFFFGALATIPFGLWLWVKFSLAPAVAVIEGAGGMNALRRSAGLVRDSWWRIFGCTIATVAIVAVVSWAIQQVFSILAWIPLSTLNFDADTAPTEVLRSMSAVMGIALIGSTACQAVLAPLQPLVSALLYVDQRLRKENLGPTLAQAAGTSFSQ
ncbi:oxidoreductase [Streptomyces sp. NPDC094032]|uniref:oxidoreductase n=1 Tax=Streptomyces sp. NPDC094032 TaxID=3155308 RepID=UPI00331BEB1C